MAVRLSIDQSGWEINIINRILPCLGRHLYNIACIMLVFIKQIRMNNLRCLLFTFSLTLSEGRAMKSVTETNKIANVFLYHLANVNK